MSKNINSIINILMLVLLLTACANTGTRRVDINIELEPSAGIKIFNVAVDTTLKHTIVSGTLHKKSHGRTIIPGHLEIIFLSPEGDMLHTLETKYRRSSLNARDSTFRVEVPLVFEEGSTVRIVHHRRSNHDENINY